MEKTVVTLNTQQAASYMRQHGICMTAATIKAGIVQRVFPFGDAIQKAKRCDCLIYKKLLDDWLAERSEEVAQQ